MALPAQLHASAALAPYCLKNCDADAPGQKLENLPKGGMAQAEQEGRVRSSRRVCRSKRRVAISKRIVVRSSKSVQVQKKCNEAQKKCFPSFSSLIVCVGLPWLPIWPDFVSSLACCSNDRQKTSKDHTYVSILWESLLFLLFLVDREKGTCCTDSIFPPHTRFSSFQFKFG